MGTGDVAHFEAEASQQELSTAGGGKVDALVLTAVEDDPACVAMCGICAGMREKTALGDVIIADRVFGFDEGKRVAGKDGVEFLHDLWTFGPEAVWKMDAAYLARELDLEGLG